MKVKDQVRRLLQAGGTSSHHHPRKSSASSFCYDREFDSLTTVNELASDDDDDSQEEDLNHHHFYQDKNNSTPRDHRSYENSEITSRHHTDNNNNNNQRKDKKNDPYADVRATMEDLATRDRAYYALHDTTTVTRRGVRSNATPLPPPSLPHLHEIDWWIAYTCYLGCFVLLLAGHIRDFCGWLLGNSRYRTVVVNKNHHKQYAPLLGHWERTYTRRLYHRVQDCFSRPIASAPTSANLQVLERVSLDGCKSMQVLGSLSQQPSQVQNDYSQARKSGILTETGSYCTSLSSCPSLTTTPSLPQPAAARQCLNLGSYNYLGFADDWQATCGPSVHATLKHYGVGSASSLQEYGRTSLHDQLEHTVAAFLGKPAALCFNMGFNTNATILPALVGPGDLLISDALNHTSIVHGARASGAAIRVFRHNDMQDLETILKQAVLLPKPMTKATTTSIGGDSSSPPPVGSESTSWNKILVVVEGIYSMEGDYCDLRNVVRLCKQYGAYVYLDEAHSIGAMGASGRGICEYTGVDPNDVDVLMGTFTKSFGAMGGYVAATRSIVEYLRIKCAASAEHTSMSPVVCQQVLTALQIITGKDGTDLGKKKLQALRDNSNYFRMRCQELGLHVLGHYDSPVIPVMLYHVTKVGAFSREAFKRGLAVVVVGPPAAPLVECRVRFCMSAGHTREQLDAALREVDEIADIVSIRYGKRTSLQLPLSSSASRI